VLDSKFGLNQDFDTHDERFEEEHMNVGDISERKGGKVTRVTLDWLANRKMSASLRGAAAYGRGA